MPNSPVYDTELATPSDNGSRCRDYYFGDINETLTVTAYGLYNDNPNVNFLAGGAIFNPSVQGLTVDLLGTTTAPFIYSH